MAWPRDQIAILELKTNMKIPWPIHPFCTRSFSRILVLRWSPNLVFKPVFKPTRSWPTQKSALPAYSYHYSFKSSLLRHYTLLITVPGPQFCPLEHHRIIQSIFSVRLSHMSKPSCYHFPKPSLPKCITNFLNPSSVDKTSGPCSECSGFHSSLC